MATSSNRDVRLGVEIQTTGEEDLRKLSVEVRALAKAGGDAAPKYLELANEIERNVAVARELGAFKTAAKGIDEASAATQRATQNAEQLRLEYTKQAEVTENVRAAQAHIRAELDATKQAIAGQVQQQALLKIALKGSTDDSGAFALASAELAAGLANLKKRQSDLNVEFTRAKEATRESNRELEALGAASLKASDTAQNLAATLRAQTTAMETAAAAGARLGADFSDVAIAQERLESSLRGGVAVLEANAAAGREKAESDRLIALEARGAAEQLDRSRIAAQSELAAIRESEAFSQQFARAQRETAAAVEALTDDLDRQAATVRGKLIGSMNDAAAAYDREQAAIAESVAMAERLTAARLEQAESDRLVALEARGLTDARERAAIAAQSELAAIKESTDFSRQFERSQRDTAAAVQALTDDLDRQAALVQGRLVKSLGEAAAAYDKAEKEAEQAAAAANRVNGYFEKLAGQRDVLKNAFGATGVRSIQAIEQEMFKVSQALVTLRAEFAGGSISVEDFDRATASARVRLAALKTEIATIPGNKTAFEGLASGVSDMITKFGALAAAVAVVGLAVKPVIEAFTALESTRRILTQVTGSAAEAGKQIEFLRNVAQQSGQSFTEVSQSYAKFAASALQAGLSTDQVQRAFKNVSLAAGNLGLSSDQAKRALEALSQIASKGTVSMEELRQQLGDALPGVLPLLAQQLGLTGKELNALVESGGLLAQEAIPAIADALTKLTPASGTVNGLTASFNRFTNVLKEAGTTVLEGALGQALGKTLQAGVFIVERLVVGFATLSETVTVAGQKIGTVIAALVSRDFKNLDQALKDIDATSKAKLDGLRARMEGVEAPTAAAAASVQALGAAAGQSSGAVAGLGTAAQQAGQAAGQAAPQHAAAAAAIASVGAAAAGASTLLPKLTVDYTSNLAAVEALVKASAKRVTSSKEEGDALKTLADLTGSEAAGKDAAVKATQLLAAAEADHALAVKANLDILVAQREATISQAALEGKTAEQVKALVAEIDKKILAQTADVEKSKQATFAAEAHAAAARRAADSLKDNTFRYEEFRLAVAAAQDRLERLTALFRIGRTTQAELTAATVKLAEANGKLRDSINDTDRALANNIARKKADLDVTTNGLKLKLEEQKTILRYAELHANEGQALQAKIKIKEIELDLARQSAKAKADEADETIRSTEQTLKELDAAGLLTPEKRIELDLRIRNAQAKKLEAQGGLEATKAIKEEVDALRGLTAAKVTAANVPSPSGRQSPSLTNPDGSQKGPNAPAAGINAGGLPTSSRSSDPASRSSAPVDASYVFTVRERMARGESFAASERPALENALRVAMENQGLGMRSTVPDLAGMRDDAAWVRTLRDALERVSATDLQGAAVGGSASLGSNALGIPNTAVPVALPTAAPAAATGAGRTVNINIAGLGSTSVNVASDADAARLESMLQQLAAAAARSA